MFILRSLAIAPALLCFGCAVNSDMPTNEPNCRSTNSTFHYVDASGGVIHIDDEESALEVSGTGIHSADSDSLSFFVSRGRDGILIRNYAAINKILFRKSQWSGIGLSCVVTRYYHPAIREIVCKNEYGDRHGYVYKRGTGVSEMFLGEGLSKQTLKLKGKNGLFWTCDF